jgi:hypothetical protein
MLVAEWGFEVIVGSRERALVFSQRESIGWVLAGIDTLML